MRILITGASGQLGQALAQKLAPVAELSLATRQEIDLSKPETIAEKLDWISPELIVNAAAYTAVDRAEDEAGLAFTVNAAAVGVLGDWVARKGVPLIHFSTDYVFDGKASEPYCEQQPVNPLSVYGKSKAEGERLLFESAAPCLVVRTAWVYAPAGKNFLRTIARLACEREELAVVGDQVGTPTASFQIAEFVHHIVSEGPASCAGLFEKSSRLVHFTAAGWTTWHGFATAIVAGMQRRGIAVKASKVRDIPNSDYPTRTTRPQFSRLSLKRLDQVFDFHPDSWERALDKVLDEMFQV
ncbi:MAG: dTDP-4-dehydrorhamnose reductase [Rhodomicrobium sp.]